MTLNQIVAAHRAIAETLHDHGPRYGQTDAEHAAQTWEECGHSYVHGNTAERILTALDAAGFQVVAIDEEADRE